MGRECRQGKTTSFGLGSPNNAGHSTGPSRLSEFFAENGRRREKSTGEISPIINEVPAMCLLCSVILISLTAMFACSASNGPRTSDQQPAPEFLFNRQPLTFECADRLPGRSEG